MSANVREVNWSDLARDPKRVADIADADGEVRVVRRDGVDLILTREDRVTRAGAGAVIAARAVRQLLASGGPTREFSESFATAMVTEFPWLKVLPPHEIRTFLHEFVETMLAAAEISQWALVDQLVTQWKATAAIYADPELAADLRHPVGDDLGPVPSPGGGDDDAETQ